MTAFLTLIFLSIFLALVMIMIPERKDLTDLPEKPRRFYVFAAPSAVVELQREAVSRCTDAWKLGGLVIEQWIKAGCPDRISPREDSIQ